MHKLLLADDSVTIQRVIELTFSGEDVHVLAVNDGEQAIARIPLERPDVVLADIGMPRKGGYDVSAFVKGRADLAHIPVLLLAGAFEPVDQMRAEQVKADGVLIKPFEPRQVIERVKELLALIPPAAVAPSAHERILTPIDPDLLAAPDTGPTGSGETEVAQSLDDLFESLNEALHQPGQAAPAWSEREAFEPLDSGFEPERSERIVIEPSVALEPSGGPVSNGTTIDDYFDRLSAAFEQAGAPPARAVSPMPDPSEERMPVASVSAPVSAAVASLSDAEEWPAEEWLSPRGTTLAFDRRGRETNPILRAVSALMAQGGMEHGSAEPEPPACPEPPALPEPESHAPSQETVDAITERVLARLVPEMVERLRRLVKQEISRSQRDVH